jgi:hypothetical protein
MRSERLRSKLTCRAGAAGRRIAATKHSKPMKLTEGIDWLAFTIGRVGGPGPAARIFGVPSKTVVDWLEKGLGSVPFGRVCDIAKVGEVPLQCLAKRLGPWPRNPDGSLKMPADF